MTTILPDVSPALEALSLALSSVDAAWVLLAIVVLAAAVWATRQRTTVVTLVDLTEEARR